MSPFRNFIRYCTFLRFKIHSTLNFTRGSICCGPLALCLSIFGESGSWESASTQAPHEEEAFFLRRIADFWQEGEYGIAKKQMEQFLSAYPTSPFSDLIRVSLGDILLGERNFSGALASYSSLSSSELIERTFLNQMLCLYNLEWYSTLADECEEFLKQDRNPEQKIQATFYLAISLYQQCLNASNEPEILLKLAKRAEPHFETLLQCERSFEITQAFAHLCCILKNFEKAAHIYLDLATADPESEDEMLFQAALIQTEYDQALALQTFENIAKKGQKRSKEAVYNQLVLSFEMGNLDSIADHRDSILLSVPEERKGMARLFIGRALLGLKKYPDAIQELQTFLIESQSSPPESILPVLCTMIEAAFESEDLAPLDLALSKLSEIDPLNDRLPKGKLFQAQLLKKAGKINEARRELANLLTAFPDFVDRPIAAFEWVDLEYQSKSWESCRSRSLLFLQEFPRHPFVPYAWRYFASSSSRLADETLENKERYLTDLKLLLEQDSLFSMEETSDWKFYLAQAYFHLGDYEKAIESLQLLLQTEIPFSQNANAQLLLSLCYRDGKNDPAGFCLCAEAALAKGANLIDENLLHLSLFNSYLELSKQVPELIEKSANHLYKAFSNKTEISHDNLIWLGEWYLSKKEHLLALDVFSSLLEKGFDETACYRLGQLYSILGRKEELISQMEKLIAQYTAEPGLDWIWEKEAKLLLSQVYQENGLKDKALELLVQITKDQPAIRSETIATAYLERAKIASLKLKSEPFDENQFVEIGSQLKNLILLKRLEQEPIHLEAALEYVDLLSNNRTDKRLMLLEKVKEDFQKSDDLLSIDYHEARKQNPNKNQIFENYIKFINEEILMAKSELANDPVIQKELQAKAKDLLLQIKEECASHPLLKRVASRLQSTDVSAFE